MDSVAEIKARLPIEELVGRYCQLQKKGRSYMALCPFHQDKHPSMQVSPEKGIAYCFACQTGGDIFSFYQAIEGVDFPQALRDLAERAGVTLERSGAPAIKKDEKERLRECLEAAAAFYRQQLQSASGPREYLESRGVSSEQIEEFQIGYAPDSFSDTYQELLKRGFSRGEILLAGLGVQKDLKEGKIYDRFRNRVMFPIADSQGRIVGFGGRTLGEDDAKYINTSESPLYRKSEVLSGLHVAKEAMRAGGSAILVEGYCDVLACHRIGVKNAVAVSGTALTEQHVKILQRSVETVILCLDQDRAGQQAAERAFHLCSAGGLQVRAVRLSAKDPADAAQEDPGCLREALGGGGTMYVDLVLEECSQGDLASVEGKLRASQRLLPLLQSLGSSVEREHYVARAAALLGVTETALKDDLQRLPRAASFSAAPPPSMDARVQAGSEAAAKQEPFSPAEVALGLLLLFPAHRHLQSELIEPEEGMAAALYRALKTAEQGTMAAALGALPAEFRERLGILQLFCEHHGFGEWSEGMALREIRRNCVSANRVSIRRKQQEITQKLLEARREGRAAEEAQLQTQYQQVLKLSKMAS